MVNILLVSHSHQIVKSVYEFMLEMKNNDFMFDYVGGIENGKHFGTNPMEIQEKITNMTKDRELVIIYDLGSSLMNTEVALQLVGKEIAEKTPYKARRLAQKYRKETKKSGYVAIKEKVSNK